MNGYRNAKDLTRGMIVYRDNPQGKKIEKVRKKKDTVIITFIDGANIVRGLMDSVAVTGLKERTKSNTP